MMLNLIKKTRDYLDYIEEHYNNVQKAWKLIQEKCSDMNFITNTYLFNEIDGLVKDHDLSKLSMEEFIPYREKFFPLKSENPDPSRFDMAWEHHKENNWHHWQNWTQVEAGFPNAVVFLVDNLCDWAAMGFKFGDTAKDYYEKNKHEIKLPEWAVELMYKIFDCIYPEG